MVVNSVSNPLPIKTMRTSGRPIAKSVITDLPSVKTNPSYASGANKLLTHLARGTFFIPVDSLPLAFDTFQDLAGVKSVADQANLAFSTISVDILYQAASNPNLHSSAILIMNQIAWTKLELPIRHAQEALEAMSAFKGIAELEPHVRGAKQILDQQIANALEEQTPAAHPSSSLVATETRTLIGVQDGVVQLTTCFAQTHIGKRTNNEDTAFLAEIEGGVVLAVFDGLGGHANGGEASAAAVTAIESFVKANSRDPDLASALSIARNEVQRLLQEERGKRPDTTAVAAKVSDNIAAIYNIGDSRTFLVRDGKIYIITHDHSGFTDTLRENKLELLSTFFDKSKLDKLKKPESFTLNDSYADYTKEYYTFTNQELRNMASGLIKDQLLAITRSVAHDKDFSIDNFQIGLEDGDILLLCSDGIHDYLPYDVFADGASRFAEMSNEEIAQYLIEQTNRQNNAHQDNITVAVYQHEQITEAPVVEDSGMSPVLALEEDDESPPPVPLKAGEQKEMGEHTREEFLEADIPVTDLDQEEPTFTTDELNAEAVAEEAAKEPVDGYPMTEEERRANPETTIVGELEQLTSGPAAQPTVELGAPVPAEDPSTERRLGRISKTIHDPNQPREHEEGHIDFEEGVATTVADVKDMGNSTVVGVDGLEKQEPAQPTGPLAILTQKPGPTTNKQAYVAALIEVAADPSSLTQEQQILELFRSFAEYKVFYRGDKDFQSSILFGEQVLLAALNDLKGED